MSNRYIPLYDENGGVIDPAFFVQSASVFAGEINGGLDRDNLPSNTISSAEVVANAFTMSGLAFNSEAGWSPDNGNTGWQNGTGTTTGASNLGILTWTAEQDAHYDFYWSGCWEWSGTYSWTPSVAAVRDITDTFDTVTLRITVDGITIATAGPFEDGAYNASAYMCGSIQLPAGAHTMKIECKVVRIVVQDSFEDGENTNAMTFYDRTIVGIGRMR